MMNTKLYICDKEVELNDKVKFCINKQFEDIVLPTTIINDWTKTISVPATASNNKLFGQLFRDDRVLVSGTGSVLTGIFFDPTKKLDMKLFYNGDCIMTGYAKLNSIKKSNGNTTYELNLFGELGRIFQELKKITLNPEFKNENYYINGNDYFRLVIDRNLIIDCWNTNEPDEKGTKFTDYCGFTPNNSYDDNFNYDTFEYNTGYTDTFSDTLTDIGFEDVTHIKPDTVVSDGLLPRQIGEFRSYLQQPFIYFSRLFEIFKDKALKLTEYEFHLDEKWFNKYNPYWGKLCYMLKKLSPDAITLAQTKPTTEQRTSAWIGPVETGTSSSGVIYDWTTPILSNLTITGSDGGDIEYDSETGYFKINNADATHIKISGYDTYTISFANDSHTLLDYSGWKFNSNQGIIVRYKIIGENGDVLHYNCTLITGENSTLSVPKMTNKVEIGTIDKNVYKYGYKDLSVPILFYFPVDLVFEDNSKGKFKIEMEYDWASKVTDVRSFILIKGLTGVRPEVQLELSEPTDMSLYTIKGNIRSNAKFTLNDMWNNDFNLFDEILKYCKMYRILVEVDDINRQIKFIHYSTYFKDYTVVDWSKKIDMSKDYLIKPISFENKYVLFNYDDGDTDIDEYYRNGNGVNFGEYKLTTGYSFNDETTNLFDGVKSPVTNTDNVLSWTDLYDNKSIQYMIPAEINVYCKDADSKYVDTFGKHFFFIGSVPFDNDEHMRAVSVSDDTEFQNANETYFYNLTNEERKDTTNYTELDNIIKYGNNSLFCTFAKPMMNFTYKDIPANSYGIYDMFWKQYINERYNIQNKQITCYMLLNYKDYINFKFNQFVTINNQLYFVNLIYDFDMTSTEPTKVDLISVSDIKGYYSCAFFDLDVFLFDPGTFYVPADGNYHLINVKLLTNKTWTIEDASHISDISFDKSGIGEINFTIKVDPGSVTDVLRRTKIYVEFKNASGNTYVLSGHYRRT